MKTEIILREKEKELKERKRIPNKKEKQVQGNEIQNDNGNGKEVLSVNVLFICSHNIIPNIT